MGSRSSSSSSSRLAAIGVVTLAVLALNAPTGASAFSSVFGKNANAGDGATEDPGLAGEPAVVTEAVTEEIHSEDPAEKPGAGEPSPTRKKSEGLLDALHVPSLLSTSGKTLPSHDVKHQNVIDPLKYVNDEPPKEVKRRNRVLNYPVCDQNEPTSVKPSDEGAAMKAYVVEKLKMATTITAPFKSATYFCNLWPQAMYRNLTAHFPPDRAFTNYATKSKSCNAQGCRFAMDVGAIIGPKSKPAVWQKGTFPAAVNTWKTLKDIVFSKDFESALFSKLGVTRKVKKREIRVFSDKSGQSNGRVHTDQDAHKVATMMLYITDAVEPMFDYGTCLHTVDQYRKRKLMKKSQGRDGRKDGESVCAHKFRYLPNTGYAFKVGPDSWHSAPNSFIKHWPQYPRNSVLINWY